MAASPLPSLTLRRRDRWSLRVRMWRAWRAGIGERRAALLAAASDAAEGMPVAALDADGDGALAEAELRLLDGRTLALGRCHRPTLAKLRAALTAGPVVVDRLADHRHCFGVYLRTAYGSLALLAPRLAVSPGNGGLRLDEALPPLTFA